MFSKSKSVAAPERERLVPPALLLTFIILVGVGLALIFPREDLRKRLVGEGRSADGLTIAYLEAWVRIAPDDANFLSVLAEQYARSGRLDDAQNLLTRMSALNRPDMQGHILRTRIEIAQQHAYDAEPDSPERAERLALMRELLDQAASPNVMPGWTLDELQTMAAQSRQIGDVEAVVKFYRALGVRDPANADLYNQKLAGIALAGGDYRDSALALLEARARSKNLHEQRTLFLQALQTLQSGNLLDEALAQAERHGGKLLDDPEVLRYLTQLALAANKPDIAAKYVERLLKVSASAATHTAMVAFAEQSQNARPVSDTEPWLARNYVFLDGPRGVALREPMGFGMRHVAADMDPKKAESGADAAPATASTGKAFNVADHDLAFRVFLAAGKLEQAQGVAQTAVQKLPNDWLWRERLAQVAEWNHQPAVALQSWLQYAQATNDERAWNHVRRLAPGLSDDRAYLAALRHRAGSGDLKTIDEVVAAYERLGEPEAGMAFLDTLANGPNARQVMERSAHLAERAGKDERAFELYGRLQTRYGARPLYAVKRANLLYAKGRLQDAMEAMLPAQAKAGSDDLLYWRTFTELARLTQRDDLLKDGYRQMMLAMGKSSQDGHCAQMPSVAARNDCLAEERYAEEADFSKLILYYDRMPIDAGRIAETVWRKGGKLEQLEMALYYYTRARAYRRVGELLGGLTPEQVREGESSATFLMRRAEYRRLMGDHGRWLADLRHAASMASADSETHAAFLWALLDRGSDEEVRATMASFRSTAENDPNLWAAYAAGAMRFQDGRTALHYLHKLQLGRSADPLWLGLVADAYEVLGQTSKAWSIRRQAWVDLHHQWSATGMKGARVRQSDADDADVEVPTRADLQAQMVALGQIFASGDVSRALVMQMLRRDQIEAAARQAAPGTPESHSQLGNVAGLPPLHVVKTAKEIADQNQIAAASREVVLAWSMSSESNELARAWLARQYAKQLQRPAYAEIAVALDSNDMDKVDRLLERRVGRLAVTSQIDANRRLGRLSTAQTQAFEAQDRARTDDAMQDTLQDALLFNAQAIEPRVTSLRQKPLDYVEYSLGAGVRLWDGFALNASSVLRDQKSRDRTQLNNVPGSDRQTEVALSYRDTGKQWLLGVGRRDGLLGFDTARLTAAWNQEGRVSYNTLLGYNQPANESAQLRVGGMKDVAGLGATWRLGLREFVSGRVEYSRFHGQDRSGLGHGLVYEVEAGYRIRTQYPDYTVRLVGTRGSYRAKAGALTPVMQRLLPAGNVPGGSDFYMPQSFTQAGILFGFGTDLVESYSRKWRPFMEIGLLHDTRAGSNFHGQIGVAGSVFGSDHLSLYIQHDTAALNAGTPLTEVGLRYRWIY